LSSRSTACIVQLAILCPVFEFVDDAEQGQVDAPRGVGQIGFQQGRQIGGGGFDLLQRFFPAGQQALHGECHNNQVHTQNADEQPDLEAGG
jgi:hypothetical protein